ncbi:MAG TPA: A24 family peptidase [Terriglobia bacterium]|nr:A24 family peptidase [Terriglobia bacterium]
MHLSAWIPGAFLALVAGWIDVRSHKIPNWLTVSGFVLGLVTSAALTGREGAESSLLGAALALVLLLPAVLLRGLGAGDWKLMGALGACLGPWRVTMVLLMSAVVAGMMAVVQVIRENRVKETAINTMTLLHGIFIFGARPSSPISLDSPGALALPFGVAVAIATPLGFWASQMLRSF